MPFNQKLQKFNAKINTVTIGSGDKTVTIGGDSTYPFYSFDAPSENTPKIGVEISDMGLENVVSEGIKAYYDGASTIGEMAKKAAAMEGADFVALILEGGDPNGVNKSVDELIAVVKEVAEETLEEGAEDVGNQYLKKALSGRNLNALMNLGFAVSDYNESRNSGDGVLKAGAKAGTLFVAGEMLGGWMMPVMLAKQLPTLAVSGIEATQNITRKMNSTARIQTFGEAQFQDTQQLATMRQAGMELAKMSQYNLQQSIMGNEAQYMHRL